MNGVGILIGSRARYCRSRTKVTTMLMPPTYCSNCGQRAQGSYCSHCGHRLDLPAVSDNSEPLETSDDWATEAQVEIVIRAPLVRGWIERSARLSRKTMTGEEFLSLFDKIMPTGIPTQKIVAFVQPITARWGIGVKRERCETLAVPVGRVIARVLCVLTRQGMPIEEIQQSTDGCRLKAVLPSDFFSFAGTFTVGIKGNSSQTEVVASAHVPGQYFDWGKCQRKLTAFFQDIQADPIFPD